MGGGRGLSGQRLHADGRARAARTALSGTVRRPGGRLLQRHRPRRGDGPLRVGRVGMAISVHTEMATPPILKWGTEEQKQRYLVPAIKGDKIAALGITEPDAGSDVASIRTRADRVDGHWRINGSKLYITNGVRCDFILLVARTGAQADGAHGITLFLVDKNSPGFTVSRKLKKLGMHSSDTAELSFNDVEVGDDAVLGEVGQGFYNLMGELQGERLIGSAGSIAGAEVAFEETLQWCKEREAF